ncbi:YggS family pyridoxal phosphate-dependent enzyme [Limnochorda pilosa]|uniref:Pyridoxal phosphate homeostasis protein n=1 Tax=Limnochorda pilosa TaxID=1555112 RepID=A0A0K2SMN5_LIMPI|nr:YggS family pyridoxal phosphate-dependent enzyme [Limnochorda pilosa]BAS28376.1 hypothetical protein LIP_2546 [Limnochorda pilosa]
MSDVGSRLQQVRARIEVAAARAGRDPSQVVVVAVTKGHPPARVDEVLEAGLDQIGENRVQEARAKQPQVRRPATWRLIGPLQRNKVRWALELFDWLDAIDRWEVAADVSRRGAQAGKTVPVLIEVNAGGEVQKHGLAPEAVDAFFSRLGDLPGLRVQGLMTVAPLGEDPEAARPVFRRMRELRERLRDRWGLALPWLSMGMSHDFEVAVEEGANMVRLGTALLGPRPATPGR